MYLCQKRFLSSSASIRVRSDGCGGATKMSFGDKDRGETTPETPRGPRGSQCDCGMTNHERLPLLIHYILPTCPSIYRTLAVSAVASQRHSRRDRLLSRQVRRARLTAVNHSRPLPPHPAHKAFSDMLIQPPTVHPASIRGSQSSA